MKISNMKTKQEFWDMGDTWYQRAHRLREVSQDDKESETRKNKASFLYRVMVSRLQKLILIASEFSQSKHTFHKGGIVSTGDEVIIPKQQAK